MARVIMIVVVVMMMIMMSVDHSFSCYYIFIL